MYDRDRLVRRLTKTLFKEARRHVLQRERILLRLTEAPIITMEGNTYDRQRQS